MNKNRYYFYNAKTFVEKSFEEATPAEADKLAIAAQPELMPDCNRIMRASDSTDVWTAPK